MATIIKTDWTERARAWAGRGMTASARGAALLAGVDDFDAGRAETECPFATDDELAERWTVGWHVGRDGRRLNPAKAATAGAPAKLNAGHIRPPSASFVDKSLPPGDR